MIVQKFFLNKNKDFGLNSYEGKLWIALLSRGISTAGELSDIANVPRSRSYDVLESLEKKGFITMKLGKPIKYIAVPPQIVIERVQKKIREDALKQVEILDSMKESKVLNELITLHSKGIDMVNPSELIGILKGRNNIYNHIEAMIKSAKKSINIISTEEGVRRKLDHFSHLFSKLSENNILVRIIAPLNKQKTPSKNVEIKVKNNISSRFIIIDNKELIFMIVDDIKTHSSYDLGIWITAPFLVNSFEGIFNHIWKTI